MEDAAVRRVGAEGQCRRTGGPVASRAQLEREESLREQYFIYPKLKTTNYQPEHVDCLVNIIYLSM